MLSKHAFRTAALCTLFAFSSLAAGCSNSNADQKKEAVNLFFESWNRLCEADSLKAHGDMNLLRVDLDFNAAYQSQPAELAFLGKGSVAGQSVDADFYIRDGHTYLNYAGTKSSSLAANLGINEEDGFHMPNPFLELSRSERENLFESVKVEGNEYTFVLKPSEVAKFLDSYGAVDVDKTVLEVEIENKTIRELSIDLKGTYDIDVASTPLTFQADIEIDQVGGTVQIDFPSDLASWPVQ